MRNLHQVEVACCEKRSLYTKNIVMSSYFNYIPQNMTLRETYYEEKSSSYKVSFKIIRHP